MELVNRYTSCIRRVDAIELSEILADSSPTIEQELIEDQESFNKKIMIKKALEKLHERDREIVTDLYLRPKQLTKTAVGKKHGISCERVRQIESRALKLLKNELERTIDI